MQNLPYYYTLTLTYVSTLQMPLGGEGGRVRTGSLNFSKTPTLSYIFGLWIEDVSHDLIF